MGRQGQSAPALRHDGVRHHPRHAERRGHRRHSAPGLDALPRDGEARLFAPARLGDDLQLGPARRHHPAQRPGRAHRDARPDTRGQTARVRLLPRPDDGHHLRHLRVHPRAPEPGPRTDLRRASRAHEDQALRHGETRPVLHRLLHGDGVHPVRHHDPQRGGRHRSHRRRDRGAHLPTPLGARTQRRTPRRHAHRRDDPPDHQRVHRYEPDAGAERGHTGLPECAGRPGPAADGAAARHAGGDHPAGPCSSTRSR